jgi:isoleucyl-tRNA synthetase
MFKKIDSKQSFPKMEEEILKFWEEQKIFEKSVEKNSADKSFVFYEGPPTANGIPGLHHVLARAFKDIIPRYKTMKGYRVERKAGWDTHGLPVELQVEKELGLRNKQEIENIVPGNPRESVIEFNKKCKESVWKYKDLWEKLTQRMGYWVDMQNPYVTYENRYIESVWWVIAQIFKTKNKKGEPLVYKGHKVVPYCYRCGTTLSSHEVAQGYQTVKDNSIFVKFKVKGEENTYFLAWTTTPWTLPGNVALAVNKEIDYVKINHKHEPGSLKGEVLKVEGEVKERSFYSKGLYILSKEIFIRNMGSAAGLSEVRFLIDGDNKEIEKDFIKYIDNFEDFTKKYDIEIIRGEDLIGLEYNPLYETNTTDKKAYYVVSGDFVTTQDGTGIVHIAPAFGADDAEMGRINNLPTLVTVDEQGAITADVPGKGIPVKKKDDKGKYKVDQLIIDDLKNRGLLFKEELYEHEYPFCWRCETPLIYYAKPSWFIRMSELREKLYENGKNINWIPENIKEGRFGEWIREAKDWAISRERYWGTPLPIWQCEKCGELKVIESQKELEELSGQKMEDLHKPYIDDVKLKCACGGEMTRASEVMDVWFDSGSMPLAQFYYPNQASKEDKEKIESGKFFPADYISEAIDQTRGWFYTLHAIATLLNEGEKVPAGYAYKNVICLGHILDAKGKKMSKSKGNVIDPMEVMDKYGADMLRWMLFTINQPGLPKRFDLKNMNEIMNRVFRMLWNSYSFFVLYANIDEWQPIYSSRDKEYANTISKNTLDKWILAELDRLIKVVDNGLHYHYDIYASAKNIEDFIDKLSNWYIRRSRKRFWKSESDEDKNNAYTTLHQVLVILSKIMAPFAPFISEEIYTNLTKKESVHLSNYPDGLSTLVSFIDDGEEYRMLMNIVRIIVNIGLQQRALNKIKVRQPLNKAEIRAVEIERLRKDKSELYSELMSIMREELNVKNIVYNSKIESEVILDTKITEDLKLEGQAREIIRFIQEMRKEAGYEVDNRIKVGYSGLSEVFGSSELNSMIKKEVLANELTSGDLESADLEKEFSVEGEKAKIQIKR